MRMLIFVLSITFVSICIAQTSPAPAAVVASQGPASFSTVFGALSTNWSLVVLLLKTFLDLLFAISPKADAPGGVVDALYLFLKSKMPTAPTQPGGTK